MQSTNMTIRSTLQHVPLIVYFEVIMYKCWNLELQQRSRQQQRPHDCVAGYVVAVQAVASPFWHRGLMKLATEARGVIVMTPNNCCAPSQASCKYIQYFGCLLGPDSEAPGSIPAAPCQRILQKARPPQVRTVCYNKESSQSYLALQRY